MRMPAITGLVCASLFALPAAAGHPDGDARDRVLTCESDKGRPRECAAETNGKVRLLRQLSRSPCIEGRSWGAQRDGVWVSDGCRGQFLVGSTQKRPSADDRFVRCESKDGRSNHCAARTASGVELVRQLSRNACIRGQNWGWDERGIWVSGGCRAEFRAASARVDDDDDARQALRCESDEGRPRHCPADTRGGVRILRQLSRAPCIEGRSWGADRRGIWVEGGCRAEFELGGGGREWASGYR